jgi:hypothetical protein
MRIAAALATSVAASGRSDGRGAAFTATFAGISLSLILSSWSRAGGSSSFVPAAAEDAEKRPRWPAAAVALSRARSCTFSSKEVSSGRAVELVDDELQRLDR